jgi:uncharacterized protein (TIGR02145 family)
MAENKNSFIKSKMNKDLDDRLVPNNEYRDAQNIAVSRSESQDVGALEAILGNELLIDSFANAKCIGSYVDEASGYVYYFLTDHQSTTHTSSSATCKILRWQPSSNTTTAQELVNGYFLNFSTTHPVHGVNLLENLLFFTDNRNQPRVINVVTASQNSSYYNDETSITVCKFSPYLAPSLIDLRSVNSLKPSTMSNAENIPVINIGGYTWATNNLDVTRYRNGDIIPEAKSYAEWKAYDDDSEGCWCYYDNQLSNGVLYQKLYNRHAVTDARNLAPYGYTLATNEMFDDLIAETATGTPGNIKSTSLWAGVDQASNNSTGFDATPSGQRKATAANDDFDDLTTEARYWVADENEYFLITNTNPSVAPIIVNNSGTIQGYAVRTVQNPGFKGWQGDPEFIKDKFVRFSYRFKYADGEYSIIAPFTQECFIPQQEGWFLNDDEDDAMRSTVINFMQNNINNIILNIELPSLDIITDYQIQEIDIIYKESDSLAYKILQNVNVNPQFITNLNNTNIYQYTYQSTIPFKTLPTDETTRVYDKVPVKALSQVIAGNRVMYGNFIQSYNAPLGLDYAVGSNDRTALMAEEYPQHSVKQNRNYQVGIIFADKWGRQTDVILSSKDTVLVAGGEPTEGSNYFTTYRPAQNASLTKAWTGDCLNIKFDSVLTVNGDTDGFYAQPSLYTIGSSSEPTFASPWAGFLNWSNQELTTVANQRQYTFTNLSYEDDTVFSLYLNQGSGWVLVDSSNYSTSDSGDDEIVVTYSNIIDTDLTSSITTNSSNATNDDYPNAAWTTNGSGTGLTMNVTVAGSAVTVITVTNGGKGFVVGNTITISKSVIGGTTDVVITLVASDIGGPASAEWKLLGKNLYNTTQYRYELDYPGFDTTFDDDPPVITNTTALFGVGRFLRGKYTDYVDVKTFSQIGSTDRYLFYTNEEISDNYMFQGDHDSGNTSARTEPKTVDQVSNYTYSINELGFYSYRVVIKQQQQEFYNVYLPGIVSGYPIEGNATEIGSTAFVTLLHDNINKVPRQLKDISNQDVQFNSELTWFGRVTNNTAVAAGSNEQYSPNTTPDSVELIGGIKDVFPDLDIAGTGDAPYINEDAIFDVEQQPFVAKVNVQKAIGVTQALFNTLTPPSEYQDAQALSVYETSPTVSNLDLFWETSTTGLISDLNEAIVGSGTAITGLSSFTWLHNEGQCSGSNITTAFFALTPQGNDVNSTAILTSVYSFLSQTDASPDTTSNRVNEFQITAAGGGSWKLQNTVPHAALEDFEFKEKYQFNIQFTQADGTISNQSFTRTLANMPPITELAVGPTPTTTDVTILDYDSALGSGVGVVKGWNGSCQKCDRTSDLAWNINECRWQGQDGNWHPVVDGQTMPPDSTNDDISWYFYIKDEDVQNQSTCEGADPDNWKGIKLMRRTNVSGVNGTPEGDFFGPFLHEITLQLTDMNGTTESSLLTFQFTPEGTSYSTVVGNWYTASTNPADPNYIVPANHFQGVPNTMFASCSTASSPPVLPIWVGGIQNWRNEKVYIYAKVSGNGTFALNANFGGYNTVDTTTMKSPAWGDGTSVFDSSGPTSIAYDLGGGADMYVILGYLDLFNPSEAQQNIGDGGVAPGDSGVDPGDGTDYNWSTSAWINCKLEWTYLDSCAVNAKIQIGWSTVSSVPPPDFHPIAPASGVPPFHTSQWYKTTDWPAT